MKKLFCKKLISAFVATVMLIAMIPAGMVTATAQTRTPAAAPAGAIEIDSAQKWNELAGTITSGDVVLTADIDFSTITDAPKTLFTTFSGTFYGNGKTVKNAEISGKALIATTLTGTVQDIVVDNCELTTTDANSAIVAGTLGGGTIQYITVSNSTVNSKDYATVGVIAGTTATATSTIQYCTVNGCTGDFRSQSGAILGAAGKTTNISNCIVNGTTTLSGYTSGGIAAIVGKVNSGCWTVNVENCAIGENVTVQYSGTNDIASSSYNYGCGLGLVIGNVGNTSGITAKVTISGCTVNGNVKIETVKSAAYIGGLVGLIATKTGNANAATVISNNTVSVNVSVGKSDTSTSVYPCIGGIIGGYISLNSEVGKLTVSGNTVGGNIKFTQNAVVGGIVGYISTPVTDNLFEKNTVSATITSHYRVGGVIGEFNNATGGFTVDECNVTGTINVPKQNGGGNTNMGGILGFFATDNAASTIDIKQCDVSAKINNSVSSSTGRGTGGIIGRLGNNNTMNVTVNVSDCSVSGEISRINSGSYMQNTAGVIGRVQATGATVNVDDVIVTAAINGGSATELGTNCAVIVGTNDSGSVNVTDCATTIANDGILVIPNDTTVMNYIVSKEGNYISDVDIRDLLPKTYIQTSSIDEETDTYIIRFVIESLVKDYDKVTTKIVVKNGEGGEVVKTFTFEECTYFESLTGHKADITETYVAGEGEFAHCECFIAVAIMDVPNDGNDYFFEVTPTFTLGGITVEGTTFGGNYAAGRPTTN